MYSKAPIEIKPVEIISRYYKPGSKLFDTLICHGERVAQKALESAAKVAHLNPDIRFIKEAAMLHDIGIFLTDAPGLDCFGEKPYVCHGYLGRELLDSMGLSKHALVCERHVGVGIKVEHIKQMNLPLPERDMVPVTIEEQLVCYADKFFSKDENNGSHEKSIQNILQNLKRYGPDHPVIFQEWVKMFT